MTSKKYIITAALFFLLLCAAAITLSILVDPYRMFGSATVDGLNALKPRIYERADLAKSYQIERVKPKTILLGNSRTEIGFDPESQVWPDGWQPVFNAALAGKGLFTESRMFQQALASGTVNTAILQVDFPDFLTSPSPEDESPSLTSDERRLLVTRAGKPSPDRVWQVWRDRLATTLTIDALTDSIRTLIDQRPGRTENMTPLGFNPLHQYQADVSRIGYYGIFEQKTLTYGPRFANSPHPDFANELTLEPFRSFVRILEIAREHNVHVIIYIPPYHQQLLEAFERSGLWPSFEAWKRALVRVIGARCHAMSILPDCVPLFDFSSENSYTAEPAPPKGDTKSQTRWYWEPGHYKAALGDMILEQLIHGRGNFGQVLTERSIEDVLRMQRQARSLAAAKSAN